MQTLEEIVRTRVIPILRSQGPSRLGDWDWQGLADDLETALKPQPTEEGKRRWEPDGYYDGVPCTCKPECPAARKGQCGCEGCRTAYADQACEQGCE